MNAIDTIADKLGVVADDFMQLVPKMTHYEMVKLEVTALLCAIIFVICVIAAVWGHKHDSIYNESILPLVVLTTGACVAVMALVVFIITVYDLICWVTIPDVQTMKYILGLIGG